MPLRLAIALISLSDELARVVGEEPHIHRLNAFLREKLWVAVQHRLDLIWQCLIP